MMGLSPQCFIPNVVEVRPPVPEKKIFFYDFYHIYGHGGHLGNVTWTIYINFGYPFLRMLHMKFSFDWSSGYREDLWNCGRRTTTADRRTHEHGHPISSPFETSVQVS